MTRLTSISPGKRLSRIIVFLVLATALALKTSAQVPTISSFSPSSAAAGASITISGTNFNVFASSNHVLIGGVKASVTAATATSLTVTVPSGIMGNGPIQVLNTATNLYATSLSDFLPAFTPNKPSLIASDFTKQAQGADDPLPSGISDLYSLYTADLDQDGYLDLLMGNGSLSNNSIVIRKNISTTGSIAFSSVINNGMHTVTIDGLTGVEKQWAIADFDGDMKQDIIVPGIVSDNIGILRNISSGTLSLTATVMATGNSTTHVVSADFDRDGKIDIAIGLNSSSTILVAGNISPGPGTISFDAPIAAAANIINVSWMAVSDLDGDGKTDIVVTDHNGNAYFYRNTSSVVGSLTFSATTISSVVTAPRGIAVGDLTGDGKPDLVITSQSGTATSFATLRNTSSVGSITFSQTNISVSSAVSAEFRQEIPVLADFNGDGKLDVAMGLEISNKVWFGIFNNTSSQSQISFASPYILYSYTNNIHNVPSATLAADFNRNGTPDIIGSVRHASRLGVFRNTLQSAPTISSFAPLSAAPGATVVINGTGFNTTAASNRVRFGTVTATVTGATATSLTVTVPGNASYAPVSVLNLGNTLSASGLLNFNPIFTPNKAAIEVTDFVKQDNFTVTGNLYGMAAGDLTGDGKPELVVTNSSATGSLIILPNTSTIGGPVAFGAAELFTPTAGTFNDPRYVALGDLDGNGWLDVAVAAHAISRVVIFLNSGSGTISTAFSVSGSFTTGMGPVGVAMGDLDGDGKPDLVTSNYYASSVSVFRNISVETGAVAFAPKQDFKTSIDNPEQANYNLTLADIDNDGKLDIISGRDDNGNPGSVALLRNVCTSGVISFTAYESMAGPRAPWSIVPGDLNADGLTDLVVSGAGSASTQMSVYTRLSAGGSMTNFARTDLTVVKRNIGIALADLNGDTRPDIINSPADAISSGDYRASIFPNTTTGSTVSFGPRTDLPGFAENPFNMVVTDMNNDGKPDIVVGHRYTGSSPIAIYRNALIATPVTQAGNLTVTGLTGTTATFSWTNGSGAERAVFIKQDNTGNAAPVNGTDYTPNTVFGSGSQIVSTGWYCVYNGTGNLVTVSGFSPSTRYQVMVTEYNDGGLSNTAQYNTNTAANNPLTVTTRATITALSGTGAASTNAATVDYRLSLGSAILSGPAISNFTVTMGGTVAGATVTSINSGSTVFTVTVNTGSGDGTVQLNFANTTSLDPGLTNALPYAGEVYTIDKTAPTLSPVTIVSNNSNTARARSGDIVTLSFTSSETIVTPTVTIAGQTAAVTNTGGDNWIAARTMTGADTDGTITFNIAFSDLAGNAGAAVSATTNSSSVLFDKTPPALLPVTIASDNANTSLAMQGNTITLNFTSDETINTPVVNIAGHTVTATNTGGNNWTASYTMTGSDAEGAISFSITSFADLAGNPGAAVTGTTNSSIVSYDMTSPLLSAVTIASANANTAKAKTGDVITIDFTANESITPSVTIAGHTVTATNTGGDNWTASYTLTATDTEGNIGFSIAFTDGSGNAGTTVTTTTNSSSVEFDRTVPTLSPVTILSNNTNTAKAHTGNMITVSFTASEGIFTPTLSIATHTITPVHVSGNAWTASYTMTGSDAEGTIPFSIAFSDISGNSGVAVTATTNSSSVLFDRTRPLLSVVGILSNNDNAGWAKTGDRITVNFTANEGVFTPTMLIAAHTVTPVLVSGNAWTASYTMTGTDTEEEIPFSIAFTDLAGNEGISVTGATDNSKVVFDRTLPVLQPVSIISNHSFTQIALPGNTVTLSFTVSESVFTPTVTIAAHTVTATGNINNAWTASYTLQSTDPDGTVPFSIVAMDMAGNASAAITLTTDDTRVDHITSTTPYFSNGAVQSLVICQDVTADISNLLKVTHTAHGQPVTITVISGPSHGELSGFDAGLVSNGAIVTPSGLSYKPTAGYSGADAFTMLVTDGIISSTTTIQVTVNALPSGSITAVNGTALCAGSVLTLTAAGGSMYKWFRDGVLISGVTGSQLGATAPGVYTAILASAAGCEAPAAGSITVTLIQQPKADFTIGSNTCINLSIAFTNTSVTSGSGSVNYLWNDGKGLTSTAISPSFTFTQTGTYNVKLKVTPQVCPALADSITRAVTITQAAAGVRNPVMDVPKNAGTALQIRTLPNAAYQWSPLRFLLTGNVPNPVTYATAEQEYLISLTVPNGCVTIDTLLVRVHENATAYLPNVFTPNGDGQNDLLMPNLVGVKQLRFFRIFNRWGKLMFETTNIGQGWDGRYKGILQPMDTYTWSIEGFDSNNILVKRQGSVTLLR